MRAAALLLALAACGPAPSAPALDPGASPGARIDVRHLADRPELTLVEREGDPEPALALVVATGSGPVASAALAGLLEARLSAAGWAVRAQADRDALRLTLSPVPAERVGEYLRALAAAVAAPVAEHDQALVRADAWLRALGRAPLAAPAVASIAACSGETGVLATDLPAVPLAHGVVEAWRAESLVAQRASLAAVGAPAFVLAVADAAERSPPWPSGTVLEPAWPEEDVHGRYQTSELAAGHARLDVAVRMGDARSAIAAVSELDRARSPLAAKLALLPQPWRATDVRATAAPIGGCVRVRLEPAGTPSGAALGHAAAAATGVVRRELAAAATRAPDPRLAAEAILLAPHADEAAARAAWWALSRARASAPLRVASALAIGVRGAPLEDPEPELDAVLADAHAREPSETAPVATHRLAVERGQGELWLLLASPCALADEGAWDAGSAALTALAVAAEARAGEAEVSIEAWLSADGVGLVAHGRPVRADESPLAHAARVGRAAASAWVSFRGEPAGFARAQGAMLSGLEDERARLLARFAEHALPAHPSWLSPRGRLDWHAAAGPDVVARRWRELLATAPTVAVIANVDGAQGEAALREVDRWLPLPRRAGCSAGGPPPQPSPLLGEGGSGAGRALVGALLPSETSAVTAAVLARAAEDLLRGALGDSVLGARAIGGARARALAIEIGAAPVALAGTVEAARVALDRLAQGSLDEASLRRAFDAAQREDLAARRHPRARLERLWRNEPPFAPPPRAALDAARTALSRDRLVVTLAAP